MLKLDFDGSVIEDIANETKRQQSKKANRKVSQAKNRNYCFTSFENVDHMHFKEAYSEYIDEINYLIVGIETCPTTQKKHIQGFIQLKAPMRLTRLKDIMQCKTMHIETTKGTPEDNVKYCSKEGNFKEYGVLQTQGKRNDLTTSLKKYTTLKEFIQNEPAIYIRYRSGVEGYYRSFGVDYIPTDSKPIVIWLYGDTGTGKSRIIKDYLKCKIAEGYRVWRRPLGSHAWFDGYVDQDIVFLDEVRGSTYKFDDLLQMLDYDCPQVPIKGSFTNFNPKVILITSNAHPEDTYQYVNDENKQQLVRRCDLIRQIKRYTANLLTTLNNL